MQSLNIKIIVIVSSIIIISAIISEIFSFFGKVRPQSNQFASDKHTKLSQNYNLNKTSPYESISILEQLNFQKSHNDYQSAYLELVNEINNTQGKINTRNKPNAISKYNWKLNDYRKNLKKLEEYKKNSKLRCFSIMKSIVKAILYYEQKSGNKVTKFDPDFFVKEKLLDATPQCPNNGSYTIIFRASKRNIYCTVHGVLKQQ